MRREFLIGLAAFFAAAVIGYSVEYTTLKASSSVTRGDLLRTVSQILAGLSPFLDGTFPLGPQGAPFRDLVSENDETARGVLAAKIMGGFADGTFRPRLGVTRSEGFEIFGRTLDYVRSHLAQPQFILEKGPHFEDVGPDHWLQPILEKLAGIGFSFASYQRRFRPSDPFSPPEALAIASAMIDYFRSELIIGEVNGASIRILPKGTLFPIRLDGWKYCWSTDLDAGNPFGTGRGAGWKDVPPQGLIPYNPGTSAILPRLLLAHEAFFPLEIPAVSADSLTILFQKIKRRTQLHQEYPGMVRETDSERLPVQLNRVVDEARFQEVARRDAPRFPANGEQADPTSWRTVPWREARSGTTGPQDKVEKPVTVGFVEIPEEVRPTEKSEDSMEIVAHVQATAIGETPSTVEYPEPTPIDREFVYGTVIHGLSRKGIAGATVLAGVRQVVTDPDGRFVISKVREPILEMTIYCEGYETLSIKHRVGYKPGPLLLALKPLQASLEGRVEDAENGQPIAGAILAIGDLSVKTDATGAFKIAQLPFTYHQIGCQARGYMDIMELVLLEAPETFKVLRLNRLSEKTLSGVMIDAPGVKTGTQTP